MSEIIEGGVLVEKLGDSPTIKILEYMLSCSEFDYTRSQVAEAVGISKITIIKYWDELIKQNLIKETRKIGNGIYYKINMNNVVNQFLDKLANKLALETMDQEASVAVEA